MPFLSHAEEFANKNLCCKFHLEFDEYQSYALVIHKAGEYDCTAVSGLGYEILVSFWKWEGGALRIRFAFSYLFLSLYIYVNAGGN